MESGISGRLNSGVYRFSIPRLRQLTSREIRDFVNSMRAPEIKAGAPLRLADIMAATREWRVKKAVQEMFPNIVSEVEVAKAKIRLHEVIRQHARKEYPNMETPAWFESAIKQVMEPLEQLQRAVEKLQRTVEQQQRDVEQLQRAVRQLRCSES